MYIEEYEIVVIIILAFVAWSGYSHFIGNSSSKMADFIKEVLFLFVIAISVILFKSLTYEHSYVPSGSMEPTLREGDHIIVSKFEYGYTKYSLPFPNNLFSGKILSSHKPQRGDVVVLAGDKLYIKRVIGLPGDVVQMKYGELYLNNKKVSVSFLGHYVDYNNQQFDRYKEFLPGAKDHEILNFHDHTLLDNTYAVQVPQDYYFVMGDNRDRSDDSRASLGLIHEHKIIGKAKYILFSHKESLMKFWTIPKSIIWDRFWQIIN